MSVVLGVDAAWSERQPSGVALVQRTETGWSCLAAAPSYQAFLDLGSGIAVDWSRRPKGGPPDPALLVDAVRRMTGGRPPTIVCVDMPISRTPIVGRRTADNLISRAFGKQGASTYSPTSILPGEIGIRFTGRFADEGFPVATATTPVGSHDFLLEVYPHPAIIRLMNAPRRLPYKVSKSRTYWPTDSASDRANRLAEQFNQILSVLGSFVSGLDAALPEPPAALVLGQLKRWEDTLDAIVCAWVGARYLDGHAEPYGDGDGAIWVPSWSGDTAGS